MNAQLSVGRSYRSQLVFVGGEAGDAYGVALSEVVE